LGGINVFDELEHFRQADLRPPKGSVSFIGGTYIAQFDLPAGASICSHKHAYDHASVLASGEVRILVGQDWKRYIAPAVINIAAGTEHLVIADKDSVWFCIHAVDQATEAYKNQDPYAMDGILIVKEKAA